MSGLNPDASARDSNTASRITAETRKILNQLLCMFMALAVHELIPYFVYLLGTKHNMDLQ